MRAVAGGGAAVAVADLGSDAAVGGTLPPRSRATARPIARMTARTRKMRVRRDTVPEDMVP
jgi:hypothetical protein